MLNITNNEMCFILSIFKNPEKEFNANSLAKHIDISSMGALKIAKKLEKENILVSRIFGKAKFYRINFNNDYAREYIKFLLKRESEQTLPYIKVWIREIKKIKSADAAILFGSVLRKQKEAKDIDVLLITNQKKFKELKKEIEKINIINAKKLHPVYQTKRDLEKNIKKQDKPILSAIKGIVVSGEDIMVKLFEKLK